MSFSPPYRSRVHADRLCRRQHITPTTSAPAKPASPNTTPSTTSVVTSALLLSGAGEGVGEPGQRAKSPEERKKERKKEREREMGGTNEKRTNTHTHTHTLTHSLSLSLSFSLLFPSFFTAPFPPHPPPGAGCTVPPLTLNGCARTPRNVTMTASAGGAPAVTPPSQRYPKPVEEANHGRPAEGLEVRAVGPWESVPLKKRAMLEVCQPRTVWEARERKGSRK